MPADKALFRSFDGGVAAHGYKCQPSELDLKGLSEVEEKILVGGGTRQRIAIGSNLSFAAAAFGEGVVSVNMTPFSKILNYDVDRGLIEVQAGATMGDIYNHLASLGRYLVTQPGYPSITVGGCIAVDIHGKNQFRDGNFSDLVESIKLYHPAYGVIEISERFNRDVFELTMGGYGLTGHILSAKLKSKPLPARYMQLQAQPVELFEELPEMISQAARHTDFTISWHDLSADSNSRSAFGRGFVLSGKFLASAEGGQKPRRQTNQSFGRGLDSGSREGLGFSMYSLPFTRLINMLYGGLQRMKSTPSTVSLAECLYPSKALRDIYYQLFGPAGFHESQVIVPVEKFPEFVWSLRDWLSHNELPVTLASSKYFGGKQKLLRFAGPGICFALNFPRCSNSLAFMQFLDQLTLRLGLIPYIVKDSRLPLAIVRHSYPEYETFRERLRKFDRERLFSSELSNRLAL
ncbi:MAG: FAD-binding protein [Cyanobacteria bacterium REEB67]|nr:FAD-binding protein [Cyanobacteria bacterium REEB67]